MHIDLHASENSLSHKDKCQQQQKSNLTDEQDVVMFDFAQLGTTASLWYHLECHGHDNQLPMQVDVQKVLLLTCISAAFGHTNPFGIRCNEDLWKKQLAEKNWRMHVLQWLLVGGSYDELQHVHFCNGYQRSTPLSGRTCKPVGESITVRNTGILLLDHANVNWIVQGNWSGVKST